MLLPNQPVPSTVMLRKMIEERIRTDAELEAFCLDYFSQVHRRFGSGMDRLQKENFLLQAAPPDELRTALLTAYPEIHELQPSSSDEPITARVFRVDLTAWVTNWPIWVAVLFVLLAGGTAALWQ